MNAESESFQLEPRTLVRLSLVVFVVCLAVSLLGARWTTTHVEIPASIDIWNLASGVAATIPLLIGLAILQRMKWRWARELIEIPLLNLGSALKTATIFELAAISLMAGIGEELLFRGFLAAWAAQWGIIAAFLIPNLLFAALHFLTPAYAVCAFLVGVYFAALLRYCGAVNLFSLMLTHSIYDLVALLWLARLSRQSFEK